MNFKNLKIKKKKEKKINIGGNDITVYPYATFRDKQDLVGLVLANSFNKGTVDLMEAQRTFLMGVIALYTDLEVSPEDKNEAYDVLNECGAIKEIISNIDEWEFEDLSDIIANAIDYQMQYWYSFIGFARDLITEMPDKILEATKELKEFDPEQYKNLMNFAKSVNGGNLPFKDIKENETFTDIAVDKIKGKLN